MQTQPQTSTNGSNTQTGAAVTPVPSGAAASQPRAQTGSLYVGDLDPDVGESLLFEIFSQVGPIISIRVCRDATTRRSLGYAYVNFRDVHDAERALDTLNYSLIKNRPCRIMWCQRDPTIRRSGVGNVFIKNLDRQIENKSLYDTFSNFGNILSCKVVTDEHGNSKGYGFIHYETKEAAEEAITTLNGMILNNKMVYVGPFIARKERKASSPEETFTNVYVKNIDPQYDDAGVRNLFGQFGPTTSVVVMKDNEGGSRGFGFVNFRNHEDAVRAVEALHGKPSYSDKTLFVCRAQKKAERREYLSKEYMSRVRENQDKYQGLNLYVKNLDDSVNDERLRQEFSVFGTITSAKVMLDDNNVPRGFGFVCFGKPDEASKALAEMHGKLVFGKPLYVAYAQRKDVRRAQLEAQYNQRNAQYFYPPQSGAMPLPGAIYPPGPAQYGYPPGYPVQRPYVYPPQVRRAWPGATPGAAPPSSVPAGGAGAPSGGPTGAPGARSGPYQSMPNYNMSAANRGPRNRQTRLPQTQSIPSQSNGPRGPGSGGPSSRGGSGGNLSRFSGNARNRRDAGYPPSQPGISSDPLDPKRLASMGNEDRKRVIGETMFELIQQEQIDSELAKKITGMILASNEDQTELIHLIEDRTVLVDKVREALELLSKQASESTS